MGLNKDSMNFLDMASRGAFLHLSASKARTILNRIIGRISYTSIHYELLEEEEESSPDQEEEVLIAKSQPIQSQDLAINPEPSIPQNLNPPKEEEIQPLEILFETKNDLFDADFGKSLNFLLHKRPSSEYNSNPLKKGSLKKHIKSNSFGGHLEKLKGGMSSDAIEGGPSHLEANSMPTLDVSYEPISKPILDLDDSPYDIFPESHDDPRNPLKHPKHRSHEDYKDDQEEP
jgi:hypothetical protein